jgi:tRNA(adenine34) deaminase
MCAGAIIQARLGTLVYGTDNPRFGAVESVMNLLRPSLWNHKVDIISGIMADECEMMLKEFFQTRRTE